MLVGSGARIGSRVREFKVMALLDLGEFIPGMEAIAMSKTWIGVLAVAAGLLIVSMPLFAHHGSSVFDANKAVMMKGNVTEWDWFNPHCLLQFDVMNEGGQVVHWIAETQNPDLYFSKSYQLLATKQLIDIMPCLG